MADLPQTENTDVIKYAIAWEMAKSIPGGADSRDEAFERRLKYFQTAVDVIFGDSGEDNE